MNNLDNRTIYILNCVEDAKYLLKKKPVSKVQLLNIFTTHYSVNDFLNSKNIDSTDLSDLITDSLQKNYQIKSNGLIEKVLKNLDDDYSGKISTILDINLKKIFYPLYIYRSKYEYSGYSLFIEALDEILKKKFFKIVFFDSVNISYFTKSKYFLNYVREYLLKYNCKFEIVEIPLKIKKKYPYFFNKAIFNPKKIYSKINKVFNNKIKLENNCIVLLENLYDLDFLKYVTEFKTLVWPKKGIKLKNHQKITNDQHIEILKLLESITIKNYSENDNILDIMINIFLNDFKINIDNYITPVLSAQLINDTININAVIWGNSPIQDSKSLVNEFFLEKGVPVIGMQHGSGYGIQNYLSFHFDSDFNRCTHYFSYGFNESDLKLTYQKQDISCKIVPVGTTKLLKTENEKKLKVIDILFPICNCISLFNACRTNASVIVKNQKKIIDKLKQKKKSIVIKPMPGFNDKNFAFPEMIKKLSEFSISSLPLNKFIEYNLPKIVIFEIISTPIYEILDKDLEILALNDFVIPFNSEALKILKKRVHVFNDIEELLKGIDLWCEGKLPKLRDDQFYNKYIYRKNSKKVIISEINKIIDQKD